ncbi:amidohydrolase family protein [Bordetella genomosp. 5]|uniref:amidohydrolase family protein n=1 Tax=Bordetella genomosp. 5 TaxID=1395608 RepID=UPI0020162700|nr:amidohydrolase family protein [Bordetella genomosp. 5]
MNAAPLPALACDCHVHIIGPQADYAMLPDRHYTPPEARLDQLRAHLSALGASRAVIVQPSVYGTDNRLLLDSLAALGEDARGVAVLDDDADDDTLVHLHDAGVRGLRINLESVGASDPARVTRALSQWGTRLRGQGWHLQVYASHGAIAQAAPALGALGVPVVLDHFAMLPPDVALESVRPILDLIASGAAYVKLSAAYRIGTDAEAIATLAQRLVALRPDRMLWASDWPHTNRTPGAAATTVSPYREIGTDHLLGEVAAWLPDDAVRREVLVDNPARLYAF